MHYKHFTIEEREKIQELFWQKKSIRTIARHLERSPSSVSREIKRNLPKEHLRYTPRLAHARALSKRGCRGREKRLKNDFIRSYVMLHLKKGWSPEQIAGRLSEEQPGMSISHEAIYQYIYAQFYRSGYGPLKSGKDDLRIYLKRRHKRRIPKGARRCQRVKNPDRPSIEERPQHIEKRVEPGHWEGDRLESRRSKAGLNALVERASGFVLITKTKNATALATNKVMYQRLRMIPPRLRQTLTLDNGSENMQWKDLQSCLPGLSCYFAHPYSSFERGTNENTNGLIRWYLPKGTDFAKTSDQEIKLIEQALNNRPRKRLAYKTPHEVFNQHLSVALQG